MCEIFIINWKRRGENETEEKVTQEIMPIFFSKEEYQHFWIVEILQPEMRANLSLCLVLFF